MDGDDGRRRRSRTPHLRVNGTRPNKHKCVGQLFKPESQPRASIPGLVKLAIGSLMGGRGGETCKGMTLGVPLLGDGVPFFSD